MLWDRFKAGVCWGVALCYGPGEGWTGLSSRWILKGSHTLQQLPLYLEVVTKVETWLSWMRDALVWGLARVRHLWLTREEDKLVPVFSCVLCMMEPLRSCVAELGVDERISGLSVSLPTLPYCSKHLGGGLLGLLVCLSLGHLCMTKGIWEQWERICRLSVPGLGPDLRELKHEAILRGESCKWPGALLPSHCPPSCQGGTGSECSVNICGEARGCSGLLIGPAPASL